MANPLALTFDQPPVSVSASPAGASADVAVPTSTEYVYLSVTANMNFRTGVGAQTAVATDPLITPGVPLVVRLGTGSGAFHVAMFGTGTFTATRVFP